MKREKSRKRKGEKGNWTEERERAIERGSRTREETKEGWIKVTGTDKERKKDRRTRKSWTKRRRGNERENNKETDRRKWTMG